MPNHGTPGFFMLNTQNLLISFIAIMLRCAGTFRMQFSATKKASLMTPTPVCPFSG